MEMVKSEGITLEVLETEETLDNGVAWAVAELIDDMDNDVRLAKGKFWNMTKEGTKAKIAEHYGWNEGSMRKYSRFAKSIERMTEPLGSLAHWKVLDHIKVPDDERPRWLDISVKSDLTPVQLRHEVLDSQRRRVEELKEEALERDIEDGVVEEDTTTEDYDERRHEAYDQSTASERAVPKKTQTSMTVSEACAVFGLGPVTWMTEDTLDILYKGYSKMLHPDVAKDDGSAMQQLNRAKEIISKIVR